MLFASYIRRQYVKFMVGLILLFNIRCSLRFILRCCYKGYWYATGKLNKPLRLSQPSQPSQPVHLKK